MRPDELRRRLDSALAMDAVLEAQENDVRGKLEECLKAEGDASELLAVYQEVGRDVEKRAHAGISEVVGLCLSAVFDEPYEFRIEFETKRGKTEARIVFSRNGMDIGDPMNASGGGVIDVAAFALRLAAVMLQRPGRRRILVLDEPFKFLSEKYRPRAAELLERIANDYGVQIIMVTHIAELKIGNIVKL